MKSIISKIYIIYLCIFRSIFKFNFKIGTTVIGISEYPASKKNLFFFLNKKTHFGSTHSIDFYMFHPL